MPIIWWKKRGKKEQLSLAGSLAGWQTNKPTHSSQSLAFAPLCIRFLLLFFPPFSSSLPHSLSPFPLARLRLFPFGGLDDC